jgi:anthranilate synthase component 1
MVKEGKKEIEEGNLLQVVLSRKIRIKTDLPPFKAYKKLRMENPSPYMFYLDFDDFQIFGSSPEVHLKVENGRALVRPIAGTRKRGKDQAEDDFLEKDLLGDEKESAEHLMLVDLARNDLGRVCKAGTVEVTDSRSIEKYKNVIHIVSEVQGELEEKTDALTALKSTFPAGTVSGAPKIRAISIIDKLEEEKRGFYAGVVGYLEPGGSLNTCISIRSGMKKGDILTLQAGAGIVYDSVPEKEYTETTDKLRSIARVAGLEV